MGLANRWSGVNRVCETAARRYEVTADRCFKACGKVVIRYSRPALPATQKDPRHCAVKVPEACANGHRRNGSAAKRAERSIASWPRLFFPNIHGFPRPHRRIPANRQISPAGAMAPGPQSREVSPKGAPFEAGSDQIYLT